MASSLTFWQKGRDRVSSDPARLSYDLLSNLTYMAALAASSGSRDKIFEHTMAQPFKTAVYFGQVYRIVKKMGHGYAKALRLVAGSATADTVKTLLLRFSSTISAGESEPAFLIQQAEVERELYTNEYQRRVDSLQKWTDAYASLMVSVTIVTVISMVTMMMGDMGQSMVVIMSFGGIAIAGVGAYTIYVASPFELKTYQGRRGTKERRWAIRSFLIGAPVSLAIGILLFPSLGPGVVFWSSG